MSSSHVRTPSRSSLTRFGVIVGAVSATVLAVASPAFAAQAPVTLGTASSFAILAGSGITNTGPTTITGDVGTFPTPTETGMGSVTLSGTNHDADAVTQGAKVDLQSAYTDAAGRTPVTNVPVELGGSTLQPGVYASPTFGLTGVLTLNALGNPDAVFVFQASSTVITASNSRVVLINGAQACHVVWQVGSSATFGTGTEFAGDVLSHTSITAATGATFRGRLLASDGAVTLDTNTITASTCSPGSPPSGTPTSTASAAPASSPAPSGSPVALSSPSPTATATSSAAGGTGGTGSGHSGGDNDSDSGDSGGAPVPPSPDTLTRVTSASLPITGTPVVPVLALGVVLLLMGIGLSLSGRHPHRAGTYQA